MYCERCGQRLADNAKFCPNCGTVTKPAAGQESSDRPDPTETGSAYGWEKGESFSYGTGSAEAPYGTEGSDPFGREGSDAQQDGMPRYDAGGGYSQGQYWNNGQLYQRQTSYTPPASSKRDGFAVAGLVLSILSLVMCCQPYLGLPLSIAGIVFSVLGMKSQIRRGLAIAGLVISIISLIGNLILLAMVIYYVAHPELLESILQELDMLEESVPGMFQQ